MDEILVLISQVVLVSEITKCGKWKMFFQNVNMYNFLSVNVNNKSLQD